MNTVNFVEELRKYTPSSDQLLALGLSTQGAKDIIDSYNCIKLGKKENAYSDPLLKLIEDYDLRKIEIGLIRFNENILEGENLVFLGKVEIDHLVLNKITSEIEVHEYHSPHRLVWNCAASGEMFLEAILICASFFSVSIFSDTLFDDNETKLQISEEAASIAGDKDKYLDFYKMLLGFDS